MRGMTETFGDRLRRARRTQGLAQLDLAEAAGLTQKHVSFLENGRVAPTRRTVLRLAEALALPAADVDLWLIVAGHAPEPPEPPGEMERERVRAAARQILAKQSPLPGALVSRRQDVLETNTGLERMLAWAGEGRDLWAETCGEGPPNLLRLTLSPAGLFPFMTEPAAIVPSYLARVARDAAGDAETLRLVEEVSAWAHVRPLLGQRPAETEAVLTERYRLGGAVMTFTTLVSAVQPSGGDLHIELFHAADRETDDLVRAIVGGDALQPPP